MKPIFQFTFNTLETHYYEVLAQGYEIITCESYYHRKATGLLRRTLVNRVDIDLSVKKAERLVLTFNRLAIKATFFLRLHAPEYNPFSFENYRILRFLIDSGHELGLHSEVVDQSAIWREDMGACLRRDIDVMNRTFGIQIKGVASHGGMTGLNNLDFWKDKKASDFGLLYEAYEKTPNYNLFDESFYISDSEWTRWKCYNKGKLVEGDFRNFAEHARDGHDLIYLLIHPDTYFDRHFYE
jgi:hypothetical protein